MITYAVECSYGRRSPRTDSIFTIMVFRVDNYGSSAFGDGADYSYGRICSTNYSKIL